MTYVDAHINSFLPDFFQAQPFNSLSAELRRRVASKLQLCSFRPGQVIYPPGELPLAVHCVVQGRVRILSSALHPDLTLMVGGKGTIVGWDSLLRRVAVGTVRAAAAAPIDSSAAPDTDEVLTLALPADEFESIALQHLLPAVTQQPSLLEIFDTLSCFLSKMPTRFGSENLKAVVHHIEREQLAIVQSLQLPIDGDALWQTSVASENRIWLLSGGATLKIAVGTPVYTAEQLEAVRSSRFPVRLLGIDRRFLAAVLQNRSLPSASASALLLSGSIPEAPPTPLPPALPPALPPHYPIRRSPAPTLIEDVVACFGMVCDRLQVPYRPGSLRRWMTEQPSLHEFDPFELCVRIAQAIGLDAEIVRFTPTAGGIERISTPAIIHYRDVFVVLHDATSKAAVLGSPRTGLLQLDPAELASRLLPRSDDAIPNCQAIVLTRLPRTPVNRFGFKWFLPALAKHRSILIQVLIASMFVQLLGLANPLLVQQVIDNVIVSANLDAMTMFGVLMVLFAILEAVLTIVRMYLFASTIHWIDLLLGSEIIRHLLRLPLSFFEKRPVGELSARLSELENIRQFLTGTSVTVVLDVIFSVLYIGVMFLYSTQLTVCVLLTIPIVIASTLFVAAIQQKLIRAKSDHSAKVQSYLVEILGGIFTVKAQHMESLVETTWRERYVQYLTSGFTTSTVSTLFSSFSHFLNTMSNLLVLWVGAGLVLRGELTLGALIAFRILTGYVTGPLLRLAGLWQRVQETSLSIELLADIMNSPAEALPQDEGNLQMPPIQGHVQYHGISFGFKPKQQQLSNVDLDIPAGAFVAIVGQSGSGKSTLLKLLPRLYTPQTGTITIDGYDVNKVNLSSLRSQIGIVPQDAVLFEGTIRDNIALFGDLPDDAVIAAAEVAEAHDFIMRLPDGYNTQVGERGAALSGGQRQRIAIARVIVRDPRLLIFDEATSALDYETERRVCDNLIQRLHDRTCFFITHRLHSITRADWILLMESGVIAEQGTHQTLMARCQLYYCLYTQQSRS
jgi:ATP-binding cassette subfamily B protein